MIQEEITKIQLFFLMVRIYNENIGKYTYKFVTEYNGKKYIPDYKNGIEVKEAGYYECIDLMNIAPVFTSEGERYYTIAVINSIDKPSNETICERRRGKNTCQTREINLLERKTGAREVKIKIIERIVNNCGTITVYTSEKTMIETISEILEEERYSFIRQEINIEIKTKTATIEDIAKLCIKALKPASK